jgi:hypothetical protein
VQHPPESHLFEGMPYYALEDVGEARGAQRAVGYRFYAPDPIPFKKSIHFQFGAMANDICSMVYWYQAGERRAYVKMPDWPEILPGSRLASSSIDLPLPDSGSWGLGGLLDNRDGAAVRNALTVKNDQQISPGEWTVDFTVTDSTETLLKTLSGSGESDAVRAILSTRGDTRKQFKRGDRVSKSSWQGFVDFNRVHRSTLASKAKNYGSAAEAVTEIEVSEGMDAQLHLTWESIRLIRLIWASIPISDRAR